MAPAATPVGSVAVEHDIPGLQVKLQDYKRSLGSIGWTAFTEGLPLLSD